MKLHRLHLKNSFRGLPAGFELYFLRDFDYGRMWEFMPYCLVGRNGNGKSNVLEALANIFYHLECMHLQNLPDNFVQDEESNPNGYTSSRAVIDAYELEYFAVFEQNPSLSIDYAHIRVSKRAEQSPVFEWLNRPKFEPHKDTILSNLEARQFMPDYVVGYSSGENEILSLPFFKMRFIHYDEYTQNLIGELPYSQPEGRMVYLDEQYSQAVFLTNYLMQEEAVLQPILDTLNIRKIKQFRVIIRQNEKIPQYPPPLDATEEEKAETLSSENQVWYELTQQISKPLLNEKDEEKKQLYISNYIIEKLKYCATAHHYDAETGLFYLDYWVEEVTKQAFRHHFENDPLVLFQAWQILLTLNLFEVSPALKKELYQSESLYVNETVPTVASDRRIARFKDLLIEKTNLAGQDSVYSKALSDGEHQFLHAMGLCLLFKNTNSLFLLDEPETHFNPDWRAKFISTLRNCLQNETKPILRDLLISSHSPFIISDCYEENVLIFRKNPETGQITCERPDFKTFGASVNQITIKVFGKVETIGDFAKATLGDLYTRWQQGENPDSLIEEAHRLLGDSVEKVLFINKILEAQKNK